MDVAMGICWIATTIALCVSLYMMKFINNFNKEVCIEKIREGHFRVYLPIDSYERLEELRIATGKETLSETLRCALDWYDKEKHGE